MSSAPEVLRELDRQCRGGHEHQAIRGSGATRSRASAIRAILRGAENQRRLDGLPVPAGVAQLQRSGLGVFELRRDAVDLGPDPGSGRTVSDGAHPEDLDIDDAVFDGEIGDEEENLAEYGLPDGKLQWLSFFGGPMWKSSYLSQVAPGLRQSTRAPRAATPPTGPVYDEYTGDLLPAKLVAEAREEEVSTMEEWEVWDEVPISQCHAETGRGPLGGRWVDCNKGDKTLPDVRSRWVAKDIAFHKSDEFFAATPPLEAMRQ